MKNLFRNLTLIFISMTLVSISACKKDDETKPAAPATEKSKIINRDFMLTDFNGSINGVVGISYEDMEACEKDNILKFMDDNTGVIDEGVTKCYKEDPQKFTFNWSLESKGKVLKYISDNDTTYADILINDGTTLKLEDTTIEDANNDGKKDTIVFSFTYIKQ